jgi:hypothetical protein
VVKAIVWSGLALLILLASLIFLGLRPGEGVSPTGPCPCGKPILTVLYANQTVPLGREDGGVKIDGMTLFQIHDGLWSSYAMTPAETGYACPGCRRSWVLNLELHGLPRNRSFLWRVRGGLLRLL